MTVLEIEESETQVAGFEAELLISRIRSARKYLVDPFHILTPAFEVEQANKRRHRYSIAELLEGATDEGIARLNEASSWAMRGASIGREF